MRTAIMIAVIINTLFFTCMYTRELEYLFYRMQIMVFLLFFYMVVILLYSVSGWIPPWMGWS